jgi:hypothetical protein
MPESDLDDLLGLRPWDQDSSVDNQFQVTERPEAQHVLQRLTSASTSSQLPG